MNTVPPIEVAQPLLIGDKCTYGGVDDWDITGTSPYALAREHVASNAYKERNAANFARHLDITDGGQQPESTNATYALPEHFEHLFRATVSPPETREMPAVEAHGLDDVAAWIRGSQALHAAAAQQAKDYPRYEAAHRKPKRVGRIAGALAAAALVISGGVAANTILSTLHTYSEQSQGEAQLPHPLPTDGLSTPPDTPKAPIETTTVFNRPPATSTTKVKIVLADYKQSASLPSSTLPRTPSISSMPSSSTESTPPSSSPSSNETTPPASTASPTEPTPSTPSPTISSPNLPTTPSTSTPSQAPSTISGITPTTLQPAIPIPTPSS